MIGKGLDVWWIRRKCRRQSESLFVQHSRNNQRGGPDSFERIVAAGAVMIVQA